MLVAEKKYYYEEQYPRVPSEVKPQPKSQPKPKIGKKIKPILLVAIGFIMAFLIVARHATISENHHKILRLEKTLEQQITRNEFLKVELASCENLDDIETKAKDELGLDYPKQGQIQFVELPEEQDDAPNTHIAQRQDKSIWDLLIGLMD